MCFMKSVPSAAYSMILILIFYIKRVYTALIVIPQVSRSDALHTFKTPKRCLIFVCLKKNLKN